VQLVSGSLSCAARIGHFLGRHENATFLCRTHPGKRCILKPGACSGRTGRYPTICYLRHNQSSPIVLELKIPPRNSSRMLVRRVVETKEGQQTLSRESLHRIPCGAPKFHLTEIATCSSVKTIRSKNLTTLFTCELICDAGGAFTSS